jgi:Flp pilus assembly protein TadG
MTSPSQWILGVEWIWLIWSVGVAVLLRVAWQTLRNWRRPCWLELLCGEEGLSYSLSYVLAFPLYFLFVCMVFEATWLLLAKIGTLYAAHAGARSAIVWSSAQPESKRNTRIHQSVWTAMTPFVTGSSDRLNISADASTQSLEYAGAYQSYRSSGDRYANAPFTTTVSRYLTAASRTACQWQVDNPQSGDVTVTVTYRAPLHIPGVARILALGSTSSHEYKITSSATLPNEAPANDSRTLGIDYQSEF